MVERKPVPPHLEARLHAAALLYREAQDERETAIVAALRAGASLREIAAAVRLSGQGVAAIGRKHGWPDEKELDRRMAEQEARRVARDWLDYAIEAIQRGEHR